MYLPASCMLYMVAKLKRMYGLDFPLCFFQRNLPRNYCCTVCVLIVSVHVARLASVAMTALQLLMSTD